MRLGGRQLAKQGVLSALLDPGGPEQTGSPGPQDPASAPVNPLSPAQSPQRPEPAASPAPASLDDSAQPLQSSLQTLQSAMGSPIGDGQFAQGAQPSLQATPSHSQASLSTQAPMQTPLPATPTAPPASVSLHSMQQTEALTFPQESTAPAEQLEWQSTAKSAASQQHGNAAASPGHSREAGPTSNPKMQLDCETARPAGAEACLKRTRSERDSLIAQEMQHGALPSSFSVKAPGLGGQTPNM